MIHKAIKVMLVEDSPSIAEMLKLGFETMRDGQFELTWRDRLSTGIEAIHATRPDVALLDLTLPDSRGLATYQKIRETAPDLPVVILTGSDDEQLGLQAVKEGAQDYLIKGTLVMRVLVRILRYAIERKGAEEVLRDQKEFFRLISESMTDMIAVLDGNGHRLYNSPSYKRLLGDPRALKGSLSFDEIHPDDRDRIREVFLNTLKTGVGERAEYRFVTYDGTIRQVESQGSVIYNSHGKPEKVVVISRDITERKLADKALRESEQRFRHLLESTTDYIYSTEIANGRTVSTSHGPGCEGVTGYRPADYTNDPGLWLRMVHPSDREAVEQMAKRINEGQAVPALEHRVVHKNGKTRWVRHTAVLRQGEDGLATGCDGLISDITERREAEERLRDSEALYQSLMETLPQSIFRKDLEGRFTYVNRHFCDDLSLTSEQLLGRTDFDFFPRAQAEKYRADDQRTTASGHIFETVEAHVAADQTQRYETQRFVHTVKAPVHDADGRCIGIQGIFWDITEKKRAEEALVISEARLQGILDNTTAIVYMKDLRGRYLLINRTYEEIFGLKREQVLGRTDRELFPEELAVTFASNDSRVLKSGSPLEFEETAPRDDGVHTYLSIKFPLADAAGQNYAVCGISTDITERKHAEVELERANRELTGSQNALMRALTDLRKSHEELKATQMQLIQAEKLESIGGLAAGVAHEVKNPLQIILLGAKYLGKVVGDADPRMSQVIKEMREAASRADVIIKGLLEFSADRELLLSQESLNEVIRGTLKFVNYAVTENNIEVVAELPENLPKVSIDKAKMEQVFINVFTNAIHAMPQRGTLTVRTGLRFLQSGELDPADRGDDEDPYRTGQMVVAVEVDDTGHGIPEANLTKVFDPFFTTKPVGKGTGLGLSVVKKIVELNGGVIDIRNRKEGGVRVTLLFKPGRKSKDEPKKENPGH